MSKCKGPHQFYKGKYLLAFYDSEERLRYMFDNVREILKFQKRPVDHYGVQLLNVEIYRALKSKTHITKFLGDPLKVYIIDVFDEQ